MLSFPFPFPFPYQYQNLEIFASNVNARDLALHCTDLINNLTPYTLYRANHTTNASSRSFAHSVDTLILCYSLASHAHTELHSLMPFPASIATPISKRRITKSNQIKSKSNQNQSSKEHQNPPFPLRHAKPKWFMSLKNPKKRSKTKK